MSDNLNKKIDKKIKTIKASASQRENKSGYSLGIKISIDLVAAIITGSIIGLGLDKFFSTKPIFFLIFLVLGIITGFYSLYKSVKNLNQMWGDFLGKPFSSIWDKKK